MTLEEYFVYDERNVIRQRRLKDAISVFTLSHICILIKIFVKLHVWLVQFVREEKS